MAKFSDLQDGDLFAVTVTEGYLLLYQKQSEDKRPRAVAYKRYAGIRHGALQLYPDMNVISGIKPDTEVYRIITVDDR